MTAPAWEACYFGTSEGSRQQLAATLGTTVHAGLPADTTSIDCVFIESRVAAEELEAFGCDNAFAACRRVKDQHGWRVYLLAQSDDAITPEIARFCLADGSFAFAPDGEGLEASVVEIRERLVPHKPKVSMEALLARLEGELVSDEGRQHSALQRMLQEDSGQTLLDELVDPETGLFDGPFASFKLDEEFKRAQRFHQPLSLLLLDIGVDLEAALDNADQRRDYLAQLAAVFLNECRDIDIIGRFTESTFMVLMPGTGSAGSEVVAVRMLEGVKARDAESGVGGTPIAGLATMPAAGIQNRQAFLARAEACLQLAHEGQGQEGFCAYSE